jgi:hypothetical protein
MDNHQAVPKNPRLGIKAYSHGYTAIWRAPQGTQLHTCTPPPVASRVGDYSRLLKIYTRMQMQDLIDGF